jgi:hypothetical protein
MIRHKEMLDIIATESVTGPEPLRDDSLPLRWAPLDFAVRPVPQDYTRAECDYDLRLVLEPDGGLHWED